MIEYRGVDSQWRDVWTWLDGKGQLVTLKSDADFPDNFLPRFVGESFGLVTLMSAISDTELIPWEEWGECVKLV